MSRLAVHELRKTYGAVEAVRGVSFEVQAGEILGLLGPNGAGKTTTVECVIGLREPDSGTVEICGLDARRRPRDVKQRIGAALQTTALQDKITPREALDLFGSFYERRATTDELIERFALAEKANAAFDTLSGGQRQRLALALAFVNKPEIVFLDEPTAGLDPQSRRELHAQIAKTRSEGHTILLTTHDLDEAQQLCDRVAIIDHGRIVAAGTPRELMAQSKSSQSVSLLASHPVDRHRLLSLGGIGEVKDEGERVRFTTTDVNRTLGELLRFLDRERIEVVEMHVERASLEDVFLELTGTHLRD
ncbi:MAG: ABC transporter ATP-binding protein [Vicinamibacterales bacterium]